MLRNNSWAISHEDTPSLQPKSYTTVLPRLGIDRSKELKTVKISIKSLGEAVVNEMFTEEQADRETQGRALMSGSDAAGPSWG